MLLRLATESLMATEAVGTLGMSLGGALPVIHTRAAFLNLGTAHKTILMGLNTFKILHPSKRC